MANNILRLKQLPDIVESGSNANGSYIKYRDGTMECWGSQAVSAYPQAIIFPQSFAATDYMFTPTWEKSGQAQRTCNANPDTRTISGISVWVRNDGSNLDETSGTIRWRAVGKWSSVSTGTGPVVSIGRGIIESGANANGNYVKYEDGTMMQWGIIANGSVSFVAITGGNSYTQSITLPQPFTDVNSYSVQASGDVSAPYVEVVRAMRSTASTFTVEVNMATLGAGSQTLNGVSWFAIGKWVSATNLAGAYTYGQGIIETGTNSNGTYIKFDNGTMIQQGTIAKSSKAFSASGAIYSQSQTITFPASFIDTSYVMPLPSVDHSGNAGLWTGQMGDGAKTISGWSVILWSYTSGTFSVGLEWTAFGRWK